MKTWVRKSLKVGILSAGFLLVGGAAAAQAASTSDNFGVGSGNQVQADVVAPITVTGNSVGLLGTASAHGSSGATASAAVSGGGTGTTSHNFGILGGNQLGLAALLPINVSGNAVGVGGTAQASGGSAAHASATGASAGGSTSGNFGVVGGNQIAPVIAIPIDVTGNAIGAFGAAQATGSTSSGAMVTPHATSGGTSGNFGIGDGNTILPIIAIPIDICGNSIGALGTGVASCGGSSGGTGNGGYGTGTGSGGYGTGTGNGSYGTGTGTGTGSGGYGTGTGGYQTGTGAGGGVAGASLMTAPKHAHKAKAAKAAKVHAHATATRSADPADESARTRRMHASASTGLGTSGNFGILGGNQATAVISIPIMITNNAIGLLGSAGI